MFGKKENEVKPEVQEKNLELEGAKEVEKLTSKDPEIDRDKEMENRSSLLDVKLNLMELSHRDVEKIEKMRYKLVAQKEKSEEKKLAEFKEFVFSCLLKKEEVSGINASR